MSATTTSKSGVGFMKIPISAGSFARQWSPAPKVSGTQPENYLCTSPYSHRSRCCRIGLALLENNMTRRPAAGAIAASLVEVAFRYGKPDSILPEDAPDSGSVWIISPSN
jgi:hypothetical protein